jgi:hypothetical protein
MQLDQIFESALLGQSAILPYTFQIEKKERGRLLSPSGQDIRILQVIVINRTPVKHLE